MSLSPMFIVLEGLDGTGKSTQIKLLQSYFDTHGISNHFVHFPRTDKASPVFGEMVAKFLRGDYGPLEQVHPELVALIYAGDRFNASNELRSRIAKGEHIIADRYVMSNVAYQCAKLNSIEERKVLMDFIFDMEYRFFCIPEPDFSVFLHVPFAFVEKQLKAQRISDERAYLHGKDDIHEKDFSFQKSVEEVYLYACQKMPEKLGYFKCVDSEGEMMTPEAIHSGLLALLKSKKRGI